MRLIDADELIYEYIDSSDTTRNEYYYGAGIVAIRKEDIDDATTIDAVEVVRCKDCKYCSYNEEHEILWCDGTRIVPFNGYCYKGKKKDDTREKKS